MNVVALLPFLLTSLYQKPTPLAEIPFRVGEAAIIVDAEINGHKMSLLFDTGFAGYADVDTSIDIGKVDGEAGIIDFVRASTVGTVTLKSMKIGGFPIKLDPDAYAYSHGVGDLTFTNGVHADGLLGLAPFLDYVTEINFEKRKIYLYPSTYDISHIRGDGKRLFTTRMLPEGLRSIQLEARVGSKPDDRLVLALDTGNAFFLATHKDSLQRIGVWGDAEGKYTRSNQIASGSVKTFFVRVTDSTIFGVPVKDSVWDVMDLPSSNAIDDGTVGYEFLKNFNITFDFLRRRVIFDNFNGQTGNEMRGDVGMTAVWSSLDKEVVIVAVSPDSPAAKAGIQKGDHLLSIDDTDFTGAIGFIRLRNILQGPVGSKVNLATSRNGNYRRCTVTREFLVNNLLSPSGG
ncbi:MAG: PDZ domain-containing protein [Armatimonadetes bacterium]|nr:PDZ domain-containing protein [Armatimonadota bacterium]